VTVTAANNDVRNDPALTVVLKGTSSDATMMLDSLVVAVTDDELVASAPRNLMATPGDQTATVTWTGPMSIGSMPITSYDWELTAAGTAPVTGSVTDLANLTVALTSLVNGVSYNFEVHAVSALGDGDAASTTVKAQPDVNALGVSPSTITEAGTDSAEVIVTLSNTTREDVTVTLTVDSTHLASVMGSPLVIEAGTTTDTAYVKAIQNVVDADNTLFLHAAADNANDPDSVQITITDDDTVPGAPRNLTANVGDTELAVEWQSPADNGTSDITHYEIRWSTDTLDDDDAWTVVTGGATGRTHTITGLTNDTAVNIEVRAVSAAGNGTAATTSGTPTG
ncbi:MAG: fibronectin type III domain-containing protein, partial [Gemmatimonadetes bacterium]|nr:fibronectin type III domain-containing protein [Gemmatimonadota bacterium]